MAMRAWRAPGSRGGQHSNAAAGGVRTLVVAVAVLIGLSHGASAQRTLRYPSPAVPSAPRLGASGMSQTRVGDYYAAAAAMSNRWRAMLSSGAQYTPSAVLRSAGGSGAGRSQADEEIQAIATSPQEYSSNDLSRTGGIRVVPSAHDQGECQTSVAHAVVMAAEAAIAAATGRDVGFEVARLSVQDLHYCSSTGRDCATDWELEPALEELQRRGSKLLTDACLKYQPRPRPAETQDDLCRKARRCDDLGPEASAGTFFYKAYTEPWQVQRHIREWGSVAASFTVYSDFHAFYRDARNADKVYTPSPGAVVEQRVAVLLIGYSNVGGYWEARGSWGLDFANNGDFKVAYGAAGILSEEVYGILWLPKPGAASVTRPQLMTRPARKAGCVTYTAEEGDYLSRIAKLAGITVERLLADNTQQIPDLSADLAGKNLLICKP